MQLEDLHTHSTMSDGRLTPQQLAEAARDRGIRVGLTDHCLYYGMRTDEEFATYMETARSLGLYLGLEHDIGRPCAFPGFITRELDYLIGSVHHFIVGYEQVLFSPYFKARLHGLPYEYPQALGDPRELLERTADIIAQSLATSPVDILGHATVLPPAHVLGLEAAFSRDWCARVVKAAVANDVAIEISGHWHSPHREFLEIASEEGATFAVGSDSHSAHGLFDLRYPAEMIAGLGIPDGRIFVPLSKAPRVRR